MAMAALRREGRRFAAPFLPPHRPVANPAPTPAFVRSSPEYSLGELPLGVRFISTQVVRNRMKSVRNIQKITKAMKMVAASKLRKIQPRAEKSRGLWQPFTALLGDMPNVDVKKNIVITVASDKGLCGGINSNVVKLARVLYQMSSGPEKVPRYVVLGDKAKAQLSRKSKDDIELSISELQMVPLNYNQISVLADDILKNVEYDALRVVFNKFKSIVSSMPTVATILSPEVVEKESESGGKLGELDSYEVEGGDSKSEILQNLTEFQFSCVSPNCCMVELERLIPVEHLVECLHLDVLFNAVLENACSEQGSRMSAMDSSSRNAGDMLQRLTLNYNKTRQAAITTDLIEIISGKSALEANW